MLEDLINFLTEIYNIIPSKEDVDRLVNNLNNNKKLDFFDLLTLQQLKICNCILNSKGVRI